MLPANKTLFIALATVPYANVTIAHHLLNASCLIACVELSHLSVCSPAILIFTSMMPFIHFAFSLMGNCSQCDFSSFFRFYYFLYAPERESMNTQYAIRNHTL